MTASAWRPMMARHARHHKDDRLSATQPHPVQPIRAEAALWTDHADAEAVIDARASRGELTGRQAERLRDWVRDRRIILPLGTSADRIGPAARGLDQAFAGAFPALLFVCPRLGPAPSPWVPELVPHPAAVLAPQTAVPAIQALLDAPPVQRFLAQLFEAPPRLMHCRGYLRPRPDPAPAPNPVIVWFDLDAATVTVTRGPASSAPDRPLAPFPIPILAIQRLLRAEFAP